MGVFGDRVLVGFEEESFFVEGVFGCGGEVMEANDKEENVVFKAQVEVSFLKGESFVGDGERRQSIDSIDWSLQCYRLFVKMFWLCLNLIHQV